jgi:hypothetical protein
MPQDKEALIRRVDPPAERGATFIAVDREHPGELARIPI